MSRVGKPLANNLSVSLKDVTGKQIILAFDCLLKLRITEKVKINNTVAGIKNKMLILGLTRILPNSILSLIEDRLDVDLSLERSVVEKVVDSRYRYQFSRSQPWHWLPDDIGSRQKSQNRVVSSSGSFGRSPSVPGLRRL